MDILNKIQQATLECFAVENDFLPDEYVDGRTETTGFTGLDFINRKLQKKGLAESDYQQLKNIKANNCEMYRKQLEEFGSIDYNVNEEKLNRNEMCFYNLTLEWCDDE